MCEWLSHGEWCDVKLLCGGRAFSAHRAVLASVSTFLRHILLSCPTDESPTFIVLPEFDLDAMSSVLYYIYNGEVIVQKQKFEMFLDIIKAMQIFIDSQYLPQNTNDYVCSDDRNKSTCYKSNIFTLGHESRDQRYINLKKGEEIQDVPLQYSSSKADCDDKQVRSQYPTSERKPSLGNLKTPYGDRQRKSFLRDLFIETYPRNGNINGLTAGVLAISNEYNRAPASVLLTNANGKHLDTEDARLEPYEKTSEHISNSAPVFHKQRCNRLEQDYGETSKSFYESAVPTVCSTESIKNKYYSDTDYIRNSVNNNQMNAVSKSTNSLYGIELQKQLLSGFNAQCGVSPSIFESINRIRAYRRKSSGSSRHMLSNETNGGRCKETDTIPSNKVILNHVLDSPWSPRIPNNYKPFRRKIEKNVQLHKSDEKEADSIVNDNNNNIEQTHLTKIGEIISTETKEEKSVMPSIQKEDTIKCSICNQVFTSNELLTSHLRRHSSNTRYTCGECGKTFSQLRNFKYHMSIHRGTREFAATCSVCGKYFNDRGYLSSHMKIHRNRKEYKCTLCPKSFNQRVAYNMHVRIHTGVKPHVCDQCGKAFSRKMLLKQHQRTHSGERPYACTHCDKRFADRSNMTLHLRLHTGVKPFSCTLCPKSFTKKHHLKSHLNFHTGSKPYSCPRCKLAFTQSSNMRTHLKKCRAPEPLPDGQD